MAVSLEVLDNISPNFEFRPILREQMEPRDFTAGWIGSRVVRRALLGRRLSSQNPLTGEVIYEEFYLPAGRNDFPLFGFDVAQRHWGYTGLEGVVTKTACLEKAKDLLFTSIL